MVFLFLRRALAAVSVTAHLDYKNGSHCAPYKLGTFIMKVDKFQLLTEKRVAVKKPSYAKGERRVYN